MHARRDIPDGSRLRPRRGRPAGLLFALLVMCFAVVPHVTLAATMMRMSLPAQPHRLQAVTATAAAPLQTAPCHEANPADHPASAMPLCCIVGCGLIAQAPTAPPLPAPVTWSKVAPPPTVLARGLATEPAERPPRSILLPI